MYSYEDRIRAVKLYIKLGKCIEDLASRIRTKSRFSGGLYPLV